MWSRATRRLRSQGPSHWSWWGLANGLKGHIISQEKIRKNLAIVDDASWWIDNGYMVGVVFSPSQVDWRIFVHYSGKRSYTKGLFLVVCKEVPNFWIFQMGEWERDFLVEILKYVHLCPFIGIKSVLDLLVLVWKHQMNSNEMYPQTRGREFLSCFVPGIFWRCCPQFFCDFVWWCSWSWGGVMKTGNETQLTQNTTMFLQPWLLAG